MRLGLVTYNLARSWDLETIIKNCQETGFEGVELRTTHAHRVEADLAPAQRDEVKRRFADSGVVLVGLGTAFEFDMVDPAQVQRQIAGTREYIKLARDLGASGVKVRPNAIHEDQGVPREQTFAQIGRALRECGEFARECGIQLRLEVHGRVTSDPRCIRAILDQAGCDQVSVCWNSNMTDLIEGGIETGFGLLGERISLAHINELWSEYPWRRLFALLRQRGYQGFCLAEIPESPEPLRLMRYYRALWQALAEV